MYSEMMRGFFIINRRKYGTRKNTAMNVAKKKIFLKELLFMQECRVRSLIMIFIELFKCVFLNSLAGF